MSFNSFILLPSYKNNLSKVGRKKERDNAGGSQKKDIGRETHLKVKLVVEGHKRYDWEARQQKVVGDGLTME